MNTFVKTHQTWGKFPGGLVVRPQRFHCPGLGSIPGQGTKIPQYPWHAKNKQTKNKTASKEDIELSEQARHIL